MKLETDRLRLEPFAPVHLDGLYALDSDPEVMRYIGPVQTRGDIETSITEMQERWSRLGYAWWAVIEQATGDVIGAACVQDMANVPDTPLEIGWRLAVSAQGKGYASEAGRAAMNFAFDHLDADLVLAVADRKNTASIRVMQRLGMTYRGIEIHYGMPLTTYVMHRIGGHGVNEAATVQKV